MSVLTNDRIVKPLSRSKQEIVSTSQDVVVKPFLPFLTPINPFSVPIVLPFPECHLNQVIPRVHCLFNLTAFT